MCRSLGPRATAVGERSFEQTVEPEPAENTQPAVPDSRETDRLCHPNGNQRVRHLGVGRLFFATTLMTTFGLLPSMADVTGGMTCPSCKTGKLKAGHLTGFGADSAWRVPLLLQWAEFEADQEQK